MYNLRFQNKGGHLFYNRSLPYIFWIFHSFSIVIHYNYLFAYTFNIIYNLFFDMAFTALLPLLLHYYTKSNRQSVYFCYLN